MKPDKAKPPGRSDSHNRLLWAVGFATMGATFLLLISPVPGYFMLGMAFVFPLQFIQTLVHEGGHLLMAWVLDQRIIQVQIGKWRFLRLRHGWQRQEAGKIAGLGGYVTSVPKSGAALRLKLILYSAGGILAEGIALLGIILILRSFWNASSIMPTWTLFFVALTLCFAFLHALSIFRNLLPREVAGISNDGLLIYSQVFNTELGQYLLVRLRFAVLDYQGVRPRDMPADLISRVIMASSSTPAANAYSQLHWYIAADRGDAALLDDLWVGLQPALEMAPSHMRVAYKLQHAWGLAAVKNEPIPGDLIETGVTIDDQESLFDLVQAFLAYQDGRLFEAQSCLQAALKRMDIELPTGINEMYRESGMALAARLDAA